jgi:hypothetical protein
MLASFIQMYKALRITLSDIKALFANHPGYLIYLIERRVFLAGECFWYCGFPCVPTNLLN